MTQLEIWRKLLDNLYRMLPHVINEGIEKGETEREIMQKVDVMLDRINELRRWLGELDGEN